MNRQGYKKMLKLAVLVYLASYLIINWTGVSWIFNYREVSGLLSDFFNPYPSIDATTVDAYFAKSQLAFGVSAQPIKGVEASYTYKQNILEIPKISISVPVIFADSTNKTVLANDLDLGTVYYPGSVLPGQVGQIVILGHSAPPGWPKIKHDWVFTDLDKLAPGDTILINFNHKQYTYTVRQKTIIQRGADVPTDNAIINNNVLTLISCWPPGKDYQRIAVQAELENS